MIDDGPTLFDEPMVYALRPTIAESFRRFHGENPRVYRMLVSLARSYKARGYERIGMKHLFEVVRWQVNMETVGAEPFKINNNWTSRYAREIERREPDLAGMFETRELKA